MNRQRKKKGTVTVMDVLNQSIERKEQAGHFRTAANYRSSMNKLAAYLGDSFRYFTFTGLTARWVEEYVGWLAARHPESPGTAEFYLRNLRAMCRSHRERHRLAWAEGSDPFTGAGFRTQPTSKRALPAGALAGLFSPELRERLDASRRESLDVLHFILFMRGMVFQDVWNLRHDMIGGDGHIRYRRSKTGILIDVEIPPEAEAIIRRHCRDDSPYVFPFLHQKKGCGSKGKDGGEEKPGSLSEESALRRVNRHAVEIGKLAGLSAPLTTYVLRHTWATLMLEAGYSVELIGQCLGHTSVTTTHIYLSRISSGQVDTAVDEMFNRLVRPYAKGAAAPPGRSGRRKERPGRQKQKSKVPNPPLFRGRGRFAGPKKKKACPFLIKKETKPVNVNALPAFPVANITYFSLTPYFMPCFSLKNNIYSLSLPGIR